MCVGTESKLYQVIIPFLPREWMLDARGRVLGSSLREIRCRINWRESLSTVKVTKVDQRNWGKNWEGFAVSFGTHESFGGHVSVALATTSSVAWLEPLAVWQNDFHCSILRYSVTKNFHRPVRRDYFYYTSSTILVHSLD